MNFVLNMRTQCWSQAVVRVSTHRMHLQSGYLLVNCIFFWFWWDFCWIHYAWKSRKCCSNGHFIMSNLVCITFFLLSAFYVNRNFKLRVICSFTKPIFVHIEKRNLSKQKFLRKNVMKRKLSDVSSAHNILLIDMNWFSILMKLIRRKRYFPARYVMQVLTKPINWENIIKQLIRTKIKTISIVLYV